MKLSTRIIKLGFAHGVFRIARSEVRERENVVVELEHDGVVGVGEAAPIAYYDHEDAKAVVETVEAAEKLMGDDPFLIEDIVARVAKAFPKSHAGVCAIDLALHDLVGKLLGVPVYRLYGLNPQKTPVTSFTIDIDEPGVMAERAAAVNDFKVLKIKIGLGRDEETLKAVRDVTDLTIRVDANTGWTREEAVEKINAIEKYDIEFVEQPIPPGDNEALRFIREHVNIPIMADESAVALASLPGLVGCVDSINVKLMKCGGLREAIRMIHFAHAHGIKVMLGCMSETSISITAAAHLSPMVQYADLDGNLMIDHDPYKGAEIDDGRLMLPDAPGLGVSERGDHVQ